MKFKSKTRLLQHLAEMVKSGYLIPEWKVEYVGKNNKPIVKATKMYKISFDVFEKQKGDSV